MEKLLKWLSGKKTTIVAILALLLTLSLTKGWIDNDWAVFFNGILVLLGYTANTLTTKMYNK